MSRAYRQAIIDLVTKEPHTHTYQDVAVRFGVSSENVRSIARRNRAIFHLFKKAHGIIQESSSLQENKPMDNTQLREVILAEQQAKLAKDKGSIAERKYKLLLDQFEQVKKENEALSGIATGKVSRQRIKPHQNKRTNEAVPIVVLSDWHSEERVNPRTIGGKNNYTLKIAEARAARVARSALKLMREKEKDVIINDVAVFLLGDFITGNIHEENVENAQLLPVEATLFAQGLLESVIDFWLQETEWTFNLYCKAGNHSRITRRVHASTELGNSLELALFVSMKRRYEGNPRVNFTIEPSYHSIVDILGTRVRYHHGHAVAYGGGVGGLHIPLRKAIKSWNETERADVDIMGHYHGFTENSTLKYIVNGSLIGYNAYAERIKAVLEEPIQGFAIVHKKYGLTALTPIFAE